MRLFPYFIVIHVTILLCTISCGQSVKTAGSISKNKEFLYVCYSSERTVSEYILTNNSDEYLYTWIDFKQVYSPETAKGCSKFFFGQAYGNISLIALLTDNCFFNGFIPEIGKTFIKRIEPKGHFRYIIINQSDQDLSNHIFYLIQSQIGFKIVNDEVLYGEDYIIL